MNPQRVLTAMTLTAAATLAGLAPASADTDVLRHVQLAKTLSDIQGDNTGASGAAKSHGDNAGNSNQADDPNVLGATVLDSARALDTAQVLV
ncbi:hypothetical protein SAVIM338S_00113 [Streptomyces avidinii]